MTHLIIYIYFTFNVIKRAVISHIVMKPQYHVAFNRAVNIEIISSNAVNDS